MHDSYTFNSTVRWEPQPHYEGSWCMGTLDAWGIVHNYSRRELKSNVTLTTWRCIRVRYDWSRWWSSAHIRVYTYCIWTVILLAKYSWGHTLHHPTLVGSLPLLTISFPEVINDISSVKLTKMTPSWADAFLTTLFICTLKHYGLSDEPCGSPSQVTIHTIIDLNT